MAEAVALKEGLILSKELGCNRVLGESDSSETIDAISGNQQWCNDSTAIFADCVDIVDSIGSVSFSHCLREANKVAHSLAKECFLSKLNCN
jgi:hypothetical protein